MNKTMTLLKDATYKNPIFCKTYYKDVNVLVACVELSECEVEMELNGLDKIYLKKMLLQL